MYSEYTTNALLLQRYLYNKAGFVVQIADNWNDDFCAFSLKSDFCRSSEKKTENQRGDGDGGGNARRVGADHALCFEIHPDQMEMGGGVEEPTATNGYPHRLLSESEEEEVCAEKEDLEDETMSLFYEFRDLPHVGEDALEADDDTETAIPLENRSTETKYASAILTDV